ncbi:cytochrome c oxidase subunit II [Parapusillimonas sp. JC17]|uniref:cytochrome c oxidase subunit II n=1 Tax=Parapusillimonas sp. JC17 TaxID=3445768 RepID=UPI003F9F967D
MLTGALAGCRDAPLSAIDAASAGARHVADVWYAMAWGSAGILLLMLALTAVAVRRSKDGDAGVSARRGHWLLIAGGVLFPVSVMAALLVYAYAKAPPKDEAAYHVQVTAHQWWWEVRYPDAPGGVRYSLNELHVPAGVAVGIELRSADVIHGFWVPKLGGKMDAIPGRTNRIVYVAPEPGVYLGTCAEYCGTGHAVMQLRVIAHPPDALEGLLSRLPTTEGVRP